ncbi:60S ribosomal protein L6 [Sparganum proliferum]
MTTIRRVEGCYVMRECLPALQNSDTGPFKFNGVPLRRVNQRYVIATKTRINMSGVAVSKALTDKFFRRIDLKPKSKNVDKLFAEEPKKYSVSDERKKLQKEVDLSLLKAIRKHKSSKILAAYLKSMFSLSRKDYPHKMVF